MGNAAKKRGGLLRRVVLASLLPAACCILAACTTNTTDTHGNYPTTHAGDDIERDPMNYNPKMENPNISGGAINNYDSKAMKKDLDDVLNP